MTENKGAGKQGKMKKAVALRYDTDKDAAPRVIGKGMGELAERIIALAREYNIPIREDADLVEILSRLNLNAQIPPETYLLVAEILAFIYRTNDKYKP
ncbi:MAG: FhlB domain-containing protein [Desulfobacterales bacterium CG2_30_60_27]|nr:MAG: FhlB domain-containing protein [Desulfobacterales bacterium CG2_30_60_27]